MVDIVLKTKNTYGGFGVRCSFNACEDTDSIEFLVILHSTVYDELIIKADLVLRSAFR